MTEAWETAPDPWLDARVTASATIQNGEDLLLPAVTDAITAYLTLSRRAALGEPTLTAANVPDRLQAPDLNALPGPETWINLINDFITPVVEALFGESFAAAVRGALIAPTQYVSEYLAAVVDRLVAWPDMVWEEMRYELLEGTQQGDSIEQLRDRIAYVTGIDALSRSLRAQINALDTEINNPATPPARRTQARAERAALFNDLDDADYQWHYPARRVARTETIGALNGGTYFGAFAWQEATGETGWKQWLATDDHRTRTSHALADGQVQPLNQPFTVGGVNLGWPGDPSGPANEVIQCRCALLTLDADEARTAAAAYTQALPGRQRVLTAANAIDQEEPMATDDDPILAEFQPPGAVPLADLEPLDEDADEPQFCDAQGREVPADFIGPIMTLDKFTDEGMPRNYLSPPDGKIASSPLPLSLNWQKEYKPEHDDAVNVGNIIDLWIAPQDTTDGPVDSLYAHLRFDLANPDGLEIARRTRDGFGGWISADLRDFDYYWTTIERRGNELDAVVIPYWKIDAATLLNGGQAMEWARLRPKDRIPTRQTGTVLVASASGNTRLPLAPRDHKWDSAAAQARVADWATDTDGDLDGDKYGEGHFWRDDASDDDLKGSYKLPFADIIDGTLTAVPDGILSAGNVMVGGMGGVDIPEADVAGVKDRISAYYAHMTREFGTDYTPPWDKSDKAAAIDDDTLVAPLLASAAELNEPFLADPVAGLNPPASWFDYDPELFAGLEPSCFVRITDEGRVYGWLGARDTPHLAYYPHTDVRIPYSNTGYALFASGPTVRTREGTDVHVGAITMGCGHAPADQHITHAQAMAWYDNAGNAVANVRCIDFPEGVAIMGAIVATATRHQVATLRSRYISGDWRPTAEGQELAGILAVTSGGFQRVRRHDRDSTPYVLIASMGAPRTDTDAIDRKRDLDEHLEKAMNSADEAEALVRLEYAAAIIESFR